MIILSRHAAPVRCNEIGVAGEPFFVGMVMMEVAFGQYDAGGMKIAQQLPVLAGGVRALVAGQR
jgi:hypothetical protein